MTDIRKIDLNLLVALDTLLDEGSVTRAAERLSLTQPTLSGKLNRLREAFGDPLFVRTQRGMLPTPAARALAGPLKQWLADAQALLRPGEFRPETAELTFTVSANDYFQAVLVVPLIARLRRLAPRIRFAATPLDLERLVEDLASGARDFAVTIRDVVPPGVEWCPLFEERYVGAARAGHPLAAGAVSLDDFCRFDHVLVSPADGAFEGPTDDALAARGRGRTVRYSVSSFPVLLEILSGEDVVGVVPERLVRGHDRLKAFELPVELPGITVVAVWHRRVESDPAHRWLRGRLVEVGKGLPLARRARGRGRERRA